jgi:hypothetical protein
MIRAALMCLFLVGCSSLIETGTVNDKDFCFGVCSLNPRAPAVESHKVEPLELNLTVKIPEDKVEQEECGKENPELC